MTKRIKFILGLIIAIFLTSCTNSNPEELSDLIKAPETSSPILEGTWQVSKIEDITNNNPISDIQIGEKLYIDKNLVAMNDEYAFPPTFTSKYVNLYDYLANRGYDFEKIEKEESAIIVNASEGQFFARDFIQRSEDEIFFIADDKIVYLSRFSKTVDPEIIDKYTTLANKERVDLKSDQNAVEDTSLLLGVRERIDLSDGKQDYDYYTYYVNINPNGKVHYKKAYDIFLRGQNEYWKVRSPKSSVTELFDKIEAFPVRLENEMDEQANINRYSFKDFDMDIRLNYVDMNFISFSYTTPLFDNTITQYGVLGTNELEDNKLVSIEEFTGEQDAYDQFKNMVINEATNKDSKIDPNDLIIENTNFGLVRDNGAWSIQTSIYTEESQKTASSQIPVRNYIEENTSSDLFVSRDQVRNINPQEKDYKLIPNTKYLIIQTADEILFHRINDGNIEKNPFFSIPTPNPTSFISFDQQIGTNAKSLEQTFVNSNTIIGGN